MLQGLLFDQNMANADRPAPRHGCKRIHRHVLSPEYHVQLMLGEGMGRFGGIGVVVVGYMVVQRLTIATSTG